MLYRYRHIIIFSLLSCYLFLGVAGYLETIVLSGFGSNPQLLKQNNGGPPPAIKAYWTQYKHIPSAVKISIPSPVVFTPPELPRVFIVNNTFTHVTFSILSDPSFSIHSSRAPPQI